MAGWNGGQGRWFHLGRALGSHKSPEIPAKPLWVLTRSRGGPPRLPACGPWSRQAERPVGQLPHFSVPGTEAQSGHVCDSRSGASRLCPQPASLAAEKVDEGQSEDPPLRTEAGRVHGARGPEVRGPPRSSGR